MNPFFSIVIPTLNEENFLPKLLSDLTKQKEKNFEVIIADSISDDNTKECIVPYEKKLKLNFIQTRQKNVASQRNYGSEKARGEYLVFLDADSRINASFLKKVKKIIIKKKGLLFLPYFLPDKEYKQYKLLFDLMNILVEFSQNLPKRFSLGGSIIIEKNFFKLIGGFDKSLFLAEDHELIQRASLWGVNSKFIKEAGVFFSLRRMKREGQINYFYKYFIASARRILFNEEIKKKIFEYQMGGQLYKEKDARNKKEEFFEHYFNQIKTLLRKILTS